MNSTPLPVDITNITNQTDFLRLVEELNRTHIPRALKRGKKTVAMLLPAPSKKKKKWEEIQVTFGNWKDLNADELIANIYHWRKEGSRPTMKLS